MPAKDRARAYAFDREAEGILTVKENLEHRTKNISQTAREFGFQPSSGRGAEGGAPAGEEKKKREGESKLGNDASHRIERTQRLKSNRETKEDSAGREKAHLLRTHEGANSPSGR